MSIFADVKSKLTGLARTQEDRYGGGQEHPLGGYLVTMAAYSTVVATLAGVAHATKRDIPGGFGARDLVLHAAATHKLSRLLAKDPVTSPLRAPFASYRGTQGPAELNEEVRGHGAQKVIGELVTCPFCTSVWVATGLTAGLIYLPKTTRLAVDTLAAIAGADMLQFGYAWMEKASSFP